MSCNSELEAVRADLAARDASIARLFLGVADAPSAPAASVYGFAGLFVALRRAAEDYMPRGADGALRGELLRALWRRVSAGGRVARSKRLEDADWFAAAVESGDRAAIMARITHPEVEERVVGRAVALAADSPFSHRAAEVAGLFRDVVIPFTREFQVEWLIREGRGALAGAAVIVSDILALCAEDGRTLATAESCTGGLVGAAITSAAGSSAAYLGGVVSYANSAKVALLGVPGEMLERHGAVSAEVAEAMAAGAREAFGADIAVSVTGIAGPGGGTDEKPVGTVFIAAASEDGARAGRFAFEGSREEVRAAASAMALEALAAELGYPANPLA